MVERRQIFYTWIICKRMKHLNHPNSSISVVWLPRTTNMYRLVQRIMDSKRCITVCQLLYWCWLPHLVVPPLQITILFIIYVVTKTCQSLGFLAKSPLKVTSQKNVIQEISSSAPPNNLYGKNPQLKRCCFQTSSHLTVENQLNQPSPT